ncbi:MAG TPA: hypothetical protein VF331_05865, partial [Polyangiales bacterium]
MTRGDNIERVAAKKRNTVNRSGSDVIATQRVARRPRTAKPVQINAGDAFMALTGLSRPFNEQAR